MSNYEVDGLNANTWTTPKSAQGIVIIPVKRRFYVTLLPKPLRCFRTELYSDQTNANVYTNKGQ